MLLPLLPALLLLLPPLLFDMLLLLLQPPLLLDMLLPLLPLGSTCRAPGVSRSEALKPPLPQAALLAVQGLEQHCGHLVVIVVIMVVVLLVIILVVMVVVMLVVMLVVMVVVLVIPSVKWMIIELLLEL